MSGTLRRPRTAALAVIALLVGSASAASFAESFRALYEWAAGHGLAGVWAMIWPLQIDVFIGIGEASLFVALVDGWSRRSRIGAWSVTLAGLAVSVAGNVGHSLPPVTDRVTAAVPPLAAAAALAVGLGVLKRVVAAKPMGPPSVSEPALTQVARDAQEAARIALAASIAVGSPLSQRAVMSRFGLSRTAERKVRDEVRASANGHHNHEGEEAA